MSQAGNEVGRTRHLVSGYLPCRSPDDSSVAQKAHKHICPPAGKSGLFFFLSLDLAYQQVVVGKCGHVWHAIRVRT